MAARKKLKPVVRQIILNAVRVMENQGEEKKKNQVPMTADHWEREGTASSYPWKNNVGNQTSQV